MKKSNPASVVSKGSTTTESELNPNRFLKHLVNKELPDINFYDKVFGEGKSRKIRTIGNPNKSSRELHKIFLENLLTQIETIAEGYRLIGLPSATGSVIDSNPLINAWKHSGGKFFYITDIKNAYPSIDLGKLAMLFVYIYKYEWYKVDFSLNMLGVNEMCEILLKGDPLFEKFCSFLSAYFGGLHGEGIAIGGVMSPYLLNLYCEVYLDAELRTTCKKYDITFTRYVDDLVFSRNKPIISDIRREIRVLITKAGLEVNHWKSKVLSIEMGTVFITKNGLSINLKTGEVRLVFLRKKRRKLHGAIGSYLACQKDWPESVNGLIAEFLYYYKNVTQKTATDRKTFALCVKFEKEWARYRKGPRPGSKKHLRMKNRR